MIMIEDVLVSDEVLEEQFVCDLSSCKGICCVKGDLGAPLSEEEKTLLPKIYPKVEKYLTPEGRELISKEGYYSTDKNGKSATPLIGNAGACAYYFVDKSGIVKCGIEQAQIDGHIEFQKPISCHLYPIRLSSDSYLTLVNYDRWDICKAACTLGSKLKVPVYAFLKDALTRRFGKEFYDTLLKAVEHRSADSNE